MFGKWYIKTFHIPWGYNRLSEGALLPLAWLTGQGTAGCSPQGEQEPLAQLILSASGDLRANPSLDSWQKGTRWAQVAGLPRPVAIIPPTPRLLRSRLHQDVKHVSLEGRCLAEASVEPQHPKSPGGLRQRDEQHLRPSGQAGPELRRAPSPGLLVATGGWANPGVGRGWRKGRGGGTVQLAGRRALPGVLCGSGDAALNLPIYLRHTDLPCLLFKARFIWLHSSSPHPPPRGSTPMPPSLPQAAAPASLGAALIAQLSGWLNTYKSFLNFKLGREATPLSATAGADALFQCKC